MATEGDGVPGLDCIAAADIVEASSDSTTWRGGKVLSLLSSYDIDLCSWMYGIEYFPAAAATTGTRQDKPEAGLVLAHVPELYLDKLQKPSRPSIIFSGFQQYSA